MSLWRRAVFVITTAALVAGATTGTATGAANEPPAAPTDVHVHPDLGCATDAPGTYLNPARLNSAGAVLLGATLSDPDRADALTAEFAAWPVGDPAARETFEWGPVPHGPVVGQASGLFQAEGTYAWTVRALDGAAASPESAPCHLTVDRTLPTAPTVTAPVYPPGRDGGGGYGVPGEFTFDSPSDDVVSYEYRSSQVSEWTPLAADGLGGPASITYTPTSTSSNHVQVRAVDRAQNRSEQTSYSFSVFENRPYVWSVVYPDWGTNPEGGVGVPGDFELTSNLTDVVSYTYRVDDGPATTVPADDARKAVVTHTPVHGGDTVLEVRSTGSTGTSSPDREYHFLVDTAPVLTTTGRFALGSTANFHLTPRQPGAVEYRYWFGRYDDTTTAPVTVPAGADGTGSFSWSPTTTEFQSLRVVSRDAAGVDSVVRYTPIYVDGGTPWISVTGAENPGRPGTLSFFTTMEDPIEFEYWFDHAPAVKHTAVAGPDGRATATFTPDRASYHVVVSRVRNATGLWSTQGSASWSVTDDPDVRSTDFPTYPASPWRSGAFTFTATLPGSTTFEYDFNGEAGTVPVDATGHATVTWTPTRSGEQYLTVATRTATGATSSRRTYHFQVADPPAVTSPDYRQGSNPKPTGVPGTFTFTPGRPGVTGYVYRFDLDYAPGEEHTVAASADGGASITFTPAAYGDYLLTVTSRTADEQVSSTGYYQFSLYEPRGVR